MMIPEGVRLNGQAYIDLILKPHFIPFYKCMRRIYGPNIMIQEDGAKYHHSKIVKSVKDEANLNIFLHPAQSPDLNPIENLWHQMKLTISKKRHRIRNNTQMCQALVEAWANIKEKDLAKLVNSMNNRYEDCIKNKGGATKY